MVSISKSYIILKLSHSDFRETNLDVEVTEIRTHLRFLADAPMVSVWNSGVTLLLSYHIQKLGCPHCPASSLTEITHISLLHVRGKRWKSKLIKSLCKQWRDANILKDNTNIQHRRKQDAICKCTRWKLLEICLWLCGMSAICGSKHFY